jgi:hypothetical protein
VGGGLFFPNGGGWPWALPAGRKKTPPEFYFLPVEIQFLPVESDFENDLTSGRGDRVYFSEDLIVLTSNLGIYRTEADGSRIANVSPDDAFTDVQAKVRARRSNADSKQCSIV